MTLENIQLDQNDRDSEYAMLDCAFDNLFPLLRSITGPGLEKSLAYFPTFDAALKKIATLKLSQKENYTSINDYIEDYNVISNQIKNYTDGIRSTV